MTKPGALWAKGCPGSRNSRREYVGGEDLSQRVAEL